MRSKIWRRSLAAVLVWCSVLAIRGLHTESVAAQTSAAVSGVTVIGPVTPIKVYIDFRTRPVAPPAQKGRAREVPLGRSGPSPASPYVIAAELMKTINRRAQVGAHAGGAGGAGFAGVTGLAGVTPSTFATASPNFEGQGYTQVVPPDPNGAPGKNHYIQTINSEFQIFNKDGSSAAGPFQINSLWPSGTVCGDNNEGDPVVLYDHLADRWLISQFAHHDTNPSHECVAISQTSNPVANTWYLYDFSFGFSEDDYPKLGVWPDGYYFSSQRGYSGGGIDVAVFDRANMLNGNPATSQTFNVGTPTVILLPGDLTGAPPAMGTPAPFARPIDGAIFGGSDRVEIWEFHVDWGNPAASTFTNTATLNTDPFISGLCNPGDLDDNCIPQPNSPTTSNATPATSNPPPALESLTVWPMGPLQYRNFGGYETLVFTHTVNATGFINNSGGTTRAGMHWYEIRRTAGVWSIYQESTFAPATNDGPVNRWMGSVAMDSAGNMALGYSTSSATSFPSIRWVGRLASDPLDLMTTTENVLVAGADSQVLNGSRWGDYSAMRVDPVDGCTFWYTNQYPEGGVVDGSGNAGGAAWGTRIGAFRFPSCNQADLSITKTDSPDPVTAGSQLNYTINVTNSGPANATNVVVSDTLPSAVMFLSSSIPCSGGSTLTCGIGNLASGASTSFTVQVQVKSNTPAGNITNTASVAANEQDPDTSNNTATATTQVITSADLTLTKECKPDQPNTQPAGTSTFCDIYVTNTGPSDALNVNVTDQVIGSSPFVINSVVASETPSDASVPACSPATPIGPASSTTISCTDFVLPAGSKLDIKVTFTDNSAGDVNDTASVNSSTPDPNVNNNTAVGRVSFKSVSDLALTKTNSPNPVTAGTNLTYSIGVTNNGPSSAANAAITDVLSSQVSFVSASPSQGACQAGVVPGDPTKPLTCNLGTLANGASATLTVVVKVNSDVAAGTILVNNASVSSDSTDPNTGNNIATASATVNTSADLAIAKTSDAAVYKPSTVVTYQISLNNFTGPSKALNVVVTDNLPNLKQAIYQSDTGGCVLSTPTTLTCNVGDLAVGQSKTVFVYVLIKGNQGTVSNTASISSATSDPNAANNTSTRTVTIGH